MSDPLDELGRTAAHDLVPPTFESLESTARQRRRLTLGTTTVAVVAVVSTIAIGFSSIRSTDAQPVVPPTPTRGTQTVTTPTITTPTTTGGDARSPRDIVASATGGPAQLAVSADDPGVEATRWQVCSSRLCTRYLGAVVVTADGFAHSQAIEVAPFTDLQWLSGTTFVTSLRSGQLAAVSVDGSVHPITVTSEAAPLREGETLFLEGYGEKPPGRHYLAVNQAGTAAHPIPMPAAGGSYVALAQVARSTSLWGIAELDPSSLVSSPDGGATWRAPYAPGGPRQLDPLDSTAPQVFAALGAGDDDSRSAATIYRSLDAGASWQTVQPAQFKNRGAGWAAVLPDGRLLITVTSVGDRLPAVPRLYESDTADWSHFHLVDTQGGLPKGFLLTATLDSSGTASLWLTGTDALLRSTDGGRSWQHARAR